MITVQHKCWDIKLNDVHVAGSDPVWYHRWGLREGERYCDVTVVEARPPQTRVYLPEYFVRLTETNIISGDTGDKVPKKARVAISRGLKLAADILEKTYQDKR
jgi:hypothetical protein